VISIGHRSTLREFHDQMMSLDGVRSSKKGTAAAS
jgi:ABC-type uncharacterized transport system fused permease/ATPase subunit